MKIGKNKVISKQARKIVAQREKIRQMEKAQTEVNYIIFGVGGPLNDNVLGYSNEQMVTFSKIAKALGLN